MRSRTMTPREIRDSSDSSVNALKNDDAEDAPPEKKRKSPSARKPSDERPQGDAHEAPHPDVMPSLTTYDA